MITEAEIKKIVLEMIIKLDEDKSCFVEEGDDPYHSFMDEVRKEYERIKFENNFG